MPIATPSTKTNVENSSLFAVVRSWAAKAPVALAGLALLAGCSAGADQSAAGTGSSESVGSTSEAIMGGSEDLTNDAVVAIRIGNTTPFEICTGSLVAPNVVLTARHCVSKSANPTVICDETGKSANGKQVGADYAAESIHVFTGSDANFSQAADAEVTQVFRPQGDVLCNQDIALLVLDRSVPGITPLPLRLHHAVQEKEGLRTVGYGKNDLGAQLGTRLRREGVGVLAVGAGVSRFQTALGPFEFEVGVSICQGDSGGPAISEKTGAIVGVVSRGGGCNDDFGHIYTQTSGFEPLIRQAFAAAGAMPLEETGDVAAPASDPAGSSAPAPHAGGCSASGGSAPTGSAGLVGLLLGAALLLRRRN